MNTGWTGTMDELNYALQSFGADRDPDGRIKIGGAMPWTFLGLGKEVVVPGETVCWINGRETNVAGLMGQTSYGMRINVIA
jgi:hypothetical protein